MILSKANIVYDWLSTLCVRNSGALSGANYCSNYNSDDNDWDNFIYSDVGLKEYKRLKFRAFYIAVKLNKFGAYEIFE